MNAYASAPSLLPAPAPSAAGSPALVRFTVTGLLATIDAHRTGRLSLARFCWELSTRIDQLATLGAPARVVTRLRWLHRSVERLTTELAAVGGHELSRHQRDSLAATVAALRAVLATLNPGPLDPGGAGRPASPVMATRSGLAAPSRLAA